METHRVRIRLISAGPPDMDTTRGSGFFFLGVAFSAPPRGHIIGSGIIRGCLWATPPPTDAHGVW
eukprot:7247938-Prymnesium_polylepis.1